MTTEDTPRTDDEQIDDRRVDDASDASLPPDRLARRDFLRATGAASAAGLLGGTASSAAAQSGSWEADADQRIQEHRTGPLEIEVVDQNGDPVSGASVDVTMQAHDFPFGTAVNAEMLNDGVDKNGQQLTDEEHQKYKDVIRNKFNTAVLENAHKWKFYEDDPQRAHDATNWLIDEGLDVRGHVCIWGSEGKGAIPNDIQTAIQNRDAETIRRRTEEHIQDIIGHYGDDIMEWEVANEVMHVYQIQKGVYGDQIQDDRTWEGEVLPWTSELLADWYNTAQEATPDGVGVAVNDYNVMSGQYDYTVGRYQNQIEHLQDAGVDLAGAGMQSHFRVDNSGNDDRMTPSEIYDRLETYAGVIDGLRVTEFDYAQSNGWDGESQAEYFRRYLKMTFSHPAVEQFLMWGFWDRGHWSNPSQAPLFDRQFNRKPGYQVWEDLVFGEWWTDDDGTTGSEGTYTVDAFLGTHLVEVDTESTSKTMEVDVTETSGKTVTVTVQDGGGGDPPVERIDGNMPTDPDSDGHYEDLNGNERVDYNDVVTYYNNREDPVITDHVDAYDYNENQRIDYNDIVELYQERSE